MKKIAILETKTLPKIIEITDDMPPAIKEEALKHNASITRINEQRSLPAREQIKRAFEWNGDWGQ